MEYLRTVPGEERRHSTVWVPKAQVSPNPRRFRTVRWAGGHDSPIHVSLDAPYEDILKLIGLVPTPTNAQMWNEFVRLAEEAEKKHGKVGHLEGVPISHAPEIPYLGLFQFMVEPNKVEVVLMKEPLHRNFAHVQKWDPYTGDCTFHRTEEVA